MWVSIAAIQALRAGGEADSLAGLLARNIDSVCNGAAWIPDHLIGDTETGHVFRLGPNDDGLRYIFLDYPSLRQELAGARAVLEYLRDCGARWQCSYALHGGALPQRVRRLAEEIKSLQLTPPYERQTALSLFVLGHYVCDAFMPLHCDYRDSDAANGCRMPKSLHHSIEARWDEDFPPVAERLATGERDVSKLIRLPDDSVIRLEPANLAVPRALREDVELKHVASISAALSRIWLDEPYRNVQELLEARGQAEFDHITNLIFRDAIQEVAAIWLKVAQDMDESAGLRARTQTGIDGEEFSFDSAEYAKLPGLAGPAGLAKSAALAEPSSPPA